MNFAECPNCYKQVNVGSKPRMAQIISCHSCKTRLEITWLDPIQLDWPYDSIEFEDEDYYEEFNQED